MFNLVKTKKLLKVKSKIIFYLFELYVNRFKFSFPRFFSVTIFFHSFFFFSFFFFTFFLFFFYYFFLYQLIPQY